VTIAAYTCIDPDEDSGTVEGPPDTLGELDVMDVADDLAELESLGNAVLHPDWVMQGASPD
jgi:hypothetical protein